MIAGRYSLDREIGRGGMGAVSLGRDETLGRAVALKRIGLLPGADSTDLARAEREAQLAARLHHPHVVSVYDLVVDEDGTHWLVMEYVDGLTLAGLVRQKGRLSTDDAAPLLWQVADALVAAHDAGIVHRDVKPSNILVDRDGRAKLTDFGIARITGDPSLTQTGLVTGSPSYLAPEVASGHRADEASDVWSLGATLFHVLAGRPPYDIGDHVLGGLYRIVHEEPPRLPDAGWMTPVLEATMVKDPAERWSMRQVRDFLAGPMRASGSHWVDEDSTQVFGAPTAAAMEEPVAARAARPVAEPSTDDRDRSRPLTLWILVALGVVLVLGLALFALVPDHEKSTSSARSSPSSSRSASSSGSSTTPSSASASPSKKPARLKPTRASMRAFIGSYVAALGSSPDTAWTMLTAKFQRESGGLDKYRSFWDGVGTGHILAISADPQRLVVSYRVRFDNFGTGRRPTVLDLVFDRGRYLIDGERTQGAG